MDGEILTEEITLENDPVYERCVTSVFDIEQLPPKDKVAMLKLRESSVGYYSIPESVENILNQMRTIDKEAFGRYYWSRNEITERLIDPNAIVVLLRDPEADNSVVGFSVARPSIAAYKNSLNVGSEDTAYVDKTVISEKYRGHHLTRKILGMLDNTLLSRGYSYVERDARIENNHAGNLLKNYKDKIVGEPREHRSIHGDQMFIRMRL